MENRLGGGNRMVILLSMMAAFSGGLMVYLLSDRIEKETMRAKWLAPRIKSGEEGILLSLNRPLFPLIFPWLRGPFFTKLSKIHGFQLKLSGMDILFEPEEFLAWSFCLMMEGLFFFLLLFGFSFLSLLAGVLAGSLYPSVWLLFKKKERIRKIERDLPIFIDLLALSVLAGLEMNQAISRLVSNLPPSLLVAEMKGMLNRLEMGESRKEALCHLKERIPLKEMRVFISILIQTIELGSPVGPVLLANAEQIRSLRLLQAEKRGILAQQKILFPLVFCILPSVFLTLFAPILIRFLTGGFENFL